MAAICLGLNKLILDVDNFQAKRGNILEFHKMYRYRDGKLLMETDK